MKSLLFVGGRTGSWSRESRYNIVDFECLFKSPIFQFPPLPCRGLSKESKSLHPFAFGIKRATYMGRKLSGVIKKGDIVDRTDREMILKRRCAGLIRTQSDSGAADMIAKGTLLKNLVILVIMQATLR
jgi:hypothetical protein